MRVILYILATIFILLGLGNGLKRWMDRPSRDEKFKITNFKNKRVIFGGKINKYDTNYATFTATVFFGDEVENFEFGDDQTVLEADRKSWFANISGKSLFLEENLWHSQRNTYFNSVSRFQDISDRFFQKIANFISDGVMGYLASIDPRGYKYYKHVHSFTVDNQLSTDLEKQETEKNLITLYEAFNADFIMRPIP